MKAELAEAPELSDEKVDNIDAMVAFSKIEENQDKLDFDKLVTNESMWNILGYNIPILDVPYLKVRKNKSQKPNEGSEVATRKGK
jgi:serine kinase of HPr protein (carbohydrate metabolism regulator)